MNKKTEQIYELSREKITTFSQIEYLMNTHSFIDGKRFFFPRDIKYFKNGGEPIPDGNGGDEEEYIMLRLRLKDGIIFEDFEKRFGKAFPRDIIKKTG